MSLKRRRQQVILKYFTLKRTWFKSGRRTKVIPKPSRSQDMNSHHQNGCDDGRVRQIVHFFGTKSRRSRKDQRQRAPDSRVYSQWPHNTQREGRSISRVLRPSSHFSLPLSPPTPLHFQHSAANNVWLLFTPFEPPPPWLALGQWIPFPWNKPPDCGCCSVLLAAPLAHCWVLRTHGNT